MSATAWEFQNRLTAILNGARKNGKPFVDVTSGNLFKQVEGQEVANLKLPLCCDVMRKMMRSGDTVLKEPPRGQDAKLTIRYQLS
jgi:hypothetical protein